MKIGVVGPKASVERILFVANQMGLDIEFIPFPYKNHEEIATCIQENDRKVNRWLFSGIIPYVQAKSVLGMKENFSYCLTGGGAALYKCFFQMGFQRQKSVWQGASIDIFDTRDVQKLFHEVFQEVLQEALEELKIPIHSVYTKTFDLEVDTDTLVQFHQNLWIAGKTNGAITCLERVYQKLQNQGVPVYWVSPTKMEIRKTLELIIEKEKTAYYKEMQISSVVISIKELEKNIIKTSEHYKVQRLELRIKDVLLKLCESIDGHLVEQSNGRYKIFGSRGVIERELDRFQRTQEQLEIEFGSPVLIGVGFGKTAFSAEVKAHHAIRHAQEKAQATIVLMYEDDMIVELVGGTENLSYSSTSNDPVLLEKLRQAQVNLKAYQRIKAISISSGWDSFTSSELAQHMSVTERNVRRILKSLQLVGLVDCVGNKTQSNRGRPSKIYHFKA
jgi:hypothetical protein